MASLTTHEQPANKRQAEHVATCLSCQAAVARDRSLRRSLSELRGALVTPQPELLPELLLAVRDAAAEEAARSEGRTRRLAYLGGAAAAATAAAAGGIALAVVARRRGGSTAVASSLAR